MTAPGEIVTKRDEIARELAKELGIFAFGEIQLPHGEITQILWGKFVDARTRLAEREAETERLKNVLVLAQTELFRIPCQGYKEWREVTDLIDKVLAAPREEPRNGRG